MNALWKMVLLFTAYLIGSFPTAMVYSHLAHHVDVRSLGDGNLGASNTKRQFGFIAGVLVGKQKAGPC